MNFCYVNEYEKGTIIYFAAILDKFIVILLDTICKNVKSDKITPENLINILQQDPLGSHFIYDDIFIVE